MKFFLLFIAFFFCTHSSAQEIVTIDYNSNISQFIGDLLLLTLGIDLSLDTGVDVYRVTYTTIGSDMGLDTASGLLMVPDLIDKALPILVYQHGTTDGRSDVPSNLDGGYQLGAILAGKGMIVVAPDFLGLGTSRGFHPYVHAETEATAAIDMVTSIIPFLEQNEINWNKQFFITGYSQGGHAAMALHKYIEEEVPDAYDVVASLPMSGPYSISTVMRQLAFTDEPYGFPAYLVYSTRGIKEINPSLYEDESQVFQEPFLDAINSFISTGDGLFDMNESLVQTLVGQFGASIPKGIFRDSIRMILENDEDHPFNVALRESDVYDWTPKAPVLMLYCESDDQVPFTNSILADSVMNQNGAENVTSLDVSNGETLDHTECIVPALNVGIPWLLGFIDTSTPTNDLIADTKIQMYPNPTDGYLKISSSEEIILVDLYNINGQKIFATQPRQHLVDLTFTGIIPGIYLIHMYTEEGLSVQKLVIQN